MVGGSFGRGVLALAAMALLNCSGGPGPADSGYWPTRPPPPAPPTVLVSERGSEPVRGLARSDASPRRGASAADPDAYCQARFARHAIALAGCRQGALESYQRLEPVFRRAQLDALAMESKRLEGCLRRHDGQLGVDWMLVEHCFSKKIH